MFPLQNGGMVAWQEPKQNQSPQVWANKPRNVVFGIKDFRLSGRLIGLVEHLSSDFTLGVHGSSSFLCGDYPWCLQLPLRMPRVFEIFRIFSISVYVRPLQPKKLHRGDKHVHLLTLATSYNL